MAYISAFARARAQDISGTVYWIELKFSAILLNLIWNWTAFFNFRNFQNLESKIFKGKVSQNPKFQKITLIKIIFGIFAQFIWNLVSKLKLGVLIIPKKFKSIGATVPEIAPMRARVMTWKNDRFRKKKISLILWAQMPEDRPGCIFAPIKGQKVVLLGGVPP